MSVRVYKVGMTFPLEPQGAIAFASGLDKIIVVEEKRSLIEWQLKEALYGRPQAPQVIGKCENPAKNEHADAEKDE